MHCAMRTTIQQYRELMLSAEEAISHDPEPETDVSWMYQEPTPEFDTNLVLASSPIGPDDVPYNGNTDDDED
ncbi:hypothetical protein EC968_009584 [Mortierella alpina]|nr:hypothetical protein EC968_009584 [Mortierella alpina]